MRLLLALVVALLSPAAGASGSVFLDDLTWTEVRDALRSGRTTIIVPVGGTEQNGPHMAIGKHNARARLLAGKIAQSLGDALVAPVLAYVPEGQIAPPSGHMRFPGTVSVPVPAFIGTLEGAARSFRQHGFVDIVLLGDSGNYQADLKSLAERLNREWRAGPARVHHIAAYYAASQQAFRAALQARGLSDAEVGGHAGAADTALLLALDPAMVRTDRFDAAVREGSGVAGDPRRASADLGQLGVDMIVEQSVAAIRSARRGKR